MNQKGFANIVLVIVIVVLIGAVGYFIFTKKSEPVAQQPIPTQTNAPAPTPTPVKTASPSPTPSPGVKSGWKTYTNSKYKFSIQYPCDTKCQSSPPAPYQNAYVEDEIWLPTTNEQTQVLIFTFSDESVKRWNDNLKGPGYFPYSVQKMHSELNLQVGQSCKIYDYFNSNEVAHSVERCSVVSLNGEKALRLVVSPEGGSDTGAKIRYLVSRGGTLWLEVNELYNTSDSAFLTDASKVTPELQEQISAATEVIDTLNFSK